MKNTKTLLIANTLKESGLRILRARPDVDLVPYHPEIDLSAFHGLLAAASGVALSSTLFQQAEIDASPMLEVAARLGVGFDRVDVPALTRRGVPLMVVGSANATSVAEHAVFLMMALAKRALEMDGRMRRGEWHERQSGLPVEMAGATVLVVGFGRIGTRTAPRCAAFGMRVLVYDPYVPVERIRAAGFEPVAELDAALPQADYVTIHCPRNAETIGLFGAARLGLLRPGAFLVNTARGGIVDEPALEAALRSGHLAGAGLDVFEDEPVGPGNRLMRLPTVIGSPHLAGVTVQSMEAMSAATARNMLSVLDGAPIRENAVNPEVFG